MAFNVTQLDDLDRAYATGAREIRYEDRVYVMRSVADMLKIRRMLREALVDINQQAQPIRVECDAFDAAQIGVEAFMHDVYKIVGFFVNKRDKQTTKRGDVVYAAKFAGIDRACLHGQKGITAELT